MKAAQYRFPYEGNAPGQLCINEAPLRVPAANEVRVQVGFAGICGSDLARYKQLPGKPHALFALLGDPSPIPGHEISGIVEALGEGVAATWGDGTPVVGSRVVVHPQVGCGECQACHSGYWTGCSRQECIQLIGLHRDGAFAEYVNAPFDHLVRIPDKLSLRDATLAEPVSVAIHSLNVAGEIDLAQPIAIIGDGAIGLLTANLLTNAGAARIVLIGRHRQRMAIASSLGVTDLRMPDQVGEEENEQWPFILLTAGSQEALALAFRMASRGGKIVTIAYLHTGDTGVDVPLVYQLIRREKSLIGACGSTLNELSSAVEMLASGAINAEALISRVIALPEIVDAGFEALAGPEHVAGKVLVTPFATGQRAT